VQFHLVAPDDDAGAYAAAEYSWGGDAVNWYSVATAAGDALQVVPPTADVGQALYWAPSCSACTSLTIVPLQMDAPLDASGISGTWTGTTYSTTSTCNEPQNGVVPCGDILCAPAGKYVVTMCVASQTSGADECVTVPFDFPGTPDVTGVLAP
jgi:hypothetical protein